MPGQQPSEGRSLGRYELMYLLGQGGMGEVHLAKLTGAAGFEKLCIVKTILPQMATDTQFVDRFHHEARVLVQLNHSNIAQVYDMGEVDRTLYMAIEYIPGVDLSRVVERCRSLDTQVPVPIAVMIGQQMCEALGYAHRKVAGDGTAMGIVHRDVSPQNVMVSYEGVVKVIDFGLAKSSARSKATLPSTVLGKLGYMSPEQAKGTPLDHRSDIYSAGIVIWELLAGRSLFQGGTVGEMVAQMAFPRIPPLREFRPEVSETLEAAVNKALGAEPNQRYNRADEFSRALNELLVRENMRVSAEDVGNYVRSMCPEEYAAERALQSRLSSGLRKRSPSGQVSPQPLPAELAGTAIRTAGGTPIPQAQQPQQGRSSGGGNSRPMTLAQVALANQGVEPPSNRRSGLGSVPQVATPKPPGQGSGTVELEQHQPPLTTGELKVAKSKAPLVVLSLVILAVLGAGGWFGYQHFAPQPSVTVVEPPPEKKVDVAEAKDVKDVKGENTVAVANTNTQPPAEEPHYDKIEVKGELFKVIHDKDDLYVKAEKGKLKVGDDFKLIGPSIGGSDVHEFYGVATIVRMDGDMIGRLALEDETIKVPDKNVSAARETTPKAVRKTQVRPAGATNPTTVAANTGNSGKISEEDDKPPPAKTEPAKTEPQNTQVAQNTEPAKTEHPTAQGPPPEPKREMKQLRGTVEVGIRGVTINNETDFDWHGCEVHLPNQTFYKFEGEAEISAHANDRILPYKWKTDPRPLDGYMRGGQWAAVFCKEGTGYLEYQR